MADPKKNGESKGAPAAPSKASANLAPSKAEAKPAVKREPTYQLSDLSCLNEQQLSGMIEGYESRLRRAEGEEKGQLEALLVAAKNERGKRWSKLPGWKDGAKERPVPPWEADEAKARAERDVEAKKKADLKAANGPSAK
jgi:hypothetical protein